MIDDVQLVEQLRARFPALSRKVGETDAVYLDGPAGTQVPQSVIDAMIAYFSRCNANHGGLFPTSVESDALLDEVHRACADFLGVEDPETIFFGQNMTSLTFALSRSLSKTWKPHDEIIVTRLDHDANVTPWTLAARDAGVTVHQIEFRKEDCTLDLDQLKSRLNERTRLVAVGCASNSVGTINPVRDICAWAREVGALTFLDAVHWAPHRRTNISEFGCDFLACSAYKFFGPHVGMTWGRRDLLDSLDAYKVRPASDSLPEKWMTGTQSHESLAGAMAAIEYLADVGRASSPSSDVDLASGGSDSSRREALDLGFAWIQRHERTLIRRLLDGLAEIPAIKVWGITDPTRDGERLPTLALTHERLSAAELAESLGERGIFTWHGNYYALCLTESLGLEPDGMLRIGLAHYNTVSEVDRLLEELRSL